MRVECYGGGPLDGSALSLTAPLGPELTSVDAEGRVWVYALQSEDTGERFYLLSRVLPPARVAA